MTDTIIEYRNNKCNNDLIKNSKAEANRNQLHKNLNTMEKQCERCNSTFLCTLNGSCWCMTTHLSEKVRVHIADLYDDCLCEKCIKEIKALLENPK
jgi:transcription initiation factor TFIIIB Brf1 subunit/transcription initiation factor TFIIB